MADKEGDPADTTSLHDLIECIGCRTDASHRGQIGLQANGAVCGPAHGPSIDNRHHAQGHCCHQRCRAESADHAHGSRQVAQTGSDEDGSANRDGGDDCQPTVRAWFPRVRGAEGHVPPFLPVSV